MKKLRHTSHSERAENDAGHKHEACKACDPDLIHHRPISSSTAQIFSSTEQTSTRCSESSAQERDAHENFQNAPHGSAIFVKNFGSAILFKIFRTLRTGARDALHGSAIFFPKFSGRSARERDFSQNFQDAPHGSAIFIKREQS